MASKEDLLLAVQTATRMLAGSGHIDLLLPRVLGICVQAVGASGGTIYLHDDSNQTLVFRHVLPEEVREKLEFENIPDDFGAAGKVFQTGKTLISEFPPKPGDQLNRIEQQTGVQVRSMITVPLQMQDEAPIGVVQLINKVGGMFEESDITVLDTVAAVATLAILNAKLSEESTRASSLLGMGKVSHDIGNLAASLYANVSVFDFAIEGLDGALKQPTADVTKRLEIVKDVSVDFRTSIDRIVGYSHLISDLSAGRKLRPNKSVQSLAESIENAASYLEPEARKKNVDLEYDIQSDAPDFSHDQLFMFRIVQNLVGNAIKAIHDIESDSNTRQMRVTVAYRFEDDKHILEVSDTGPGMSKETASRILAGTAVSRWAKESGSGWGTKIVLELTASHDGSVFIDSKIGKGSTFRIEFPHTIQT